MSCRLNRRDITLFTVSAILSIDGLAAAAVMGASSLTWFLLSFLGFALPYALISTELGTRWPSQGGIIYWIRLAFGGRWSARASWLYWINVALWMPAAFIMMAGIFSQLFWDEMPLWGQIILALGATWLAVGISCLSLDIGKWLPNAGACCKIFIVLCLGVGGVITAWQNGIANTISFTTLAPQWNEGLRFFPVIVFSMIGFDLVCCAGDDIAEPERNLPVAMLVSGLIILVLYLFAVFGILAALPVEEIGVIEGLLSTFEKLLSPLPGYHWLVLGLGIMVMFSQMTNIVTWSIGANRAACEAAADNELPALFGKTHARFNTPIGASLLSGGVSSGIILGYGLMAESADALFWSLFSFANLVFLLPYVLMFPAYMVLKQKFNDQKKGWQIPGKRWTIRILVTLPMLFAIQAAVFFVIPPGLSDTSHTATILLGLLAVIIIGEWVCSPYAVDKDNFNECTAR